MKFLVTGASGMLGANLCRLLASQGHEIHALVRAPLTHPLLENLPIQSFRGDITDKESVLRAAQGCDGLFHIAGFISYLPRQRSQCFQVNVQGAETVLSAAAQAGVPRAVLTSSTAAVGIPFDEQPLDENANFAPRFETNPYMASKRAAELAARSRKDIDVVSVNPATIYGAGDVKMNTGGIFKNVQSGRLRSMPPGGIGVVSVNDCAQGHWDAWQHGEAGERYILCSHNCPLPDVLRQIAAVLDVPPPTRTLPRSLFWPAYWLAWLNDQTLGRYQGQISRFVVEIGFRHRYFNSEKARRELNWTPRESVAAMLQQAADFYRRHNLLES